MRGCTTFLTASKKRVLPCMLGAQHSRCMPPSCSPHEIKMGALFAAPASGHGRAAPMPVRVGPGASVSRKKVMTIDGSRLGSSTARPSCPSHRCRHARRGHSLGTGLLLLLLPEGEEADARDLDDLEAHTGDISLGLAAATETGDEDLVVLVDLRAPARRSERSDRERKCQRGK